MKNISAKYSALQTEEDGLVGLVGQSDKSKKEQGLSYESIFKYSAPSCSHSGGFGEYWRPTEYSVVNDIHHDGGLVESIVWLFLHPPFATNDTARSINQSAIVHGSDSIFKTTSAIVRHVTWVFLLVLFSFSWMLLFPFHWYWTLSRVRLNEAVVIFRVGQAPIVRKKPGSFICIWPVLDRLHRVSLSRRGFSVPPTQIGLNDGSVVRLGADISFHVTDPLRFVRMASDTATSIRHVVHGQFVNHLASQSLDTLQRFSSGMQTEMRQICFHHLSQFGVFVDTFTLSQLEVIRQPSDPGREFIKTVLDAIGSSGPVNPLSSIISSAMPFMTPNGMPVQQPSANNETLSNVTGATEKSDTCNNSSDIDQGKASHITEFLSSLLRQVSAETRSGLNIGPDTMFRLTLGKNDSWLLFPYTGHVDGPVRPSQLEGSSNVSGYKERANLYLADWETLESLREGKMSPLMATMSGLLHVSGDSAALAALFDPTKMP